MKKGRQMAEIIRPISFYRPVMRSSFFLSLSHPKSHSHRLSIEELYATVDGRIVSIFSLLLLLLLLGFFFCFVSFRVFFETLLLSPLYSLNPACSSV